MKKNHTEKNTVTEMKNTLQGINSKWNDAEEWTSKLEDWMVEFTAVEQSKKKEWKEMKTP